MSYIKAVIKQLFNELVDLYFAHSFLCDIRVWLAVSLFSFWLLREIRTFPLSVFWYMLILKVLKPVLYACWFSYFVIFFKYVFITTICRICKKNRNGWSFDKMLYDYLEENSWKVVRLAIYRNKTKDRGKGWARRRDLHCKIISKNFLKYLKGRDKFGRDTYLPIITIIIIPFVWNFEII